MKMRLHYAILVLFVCIIGSCTTEPVNNADTTIIEAENVEAIEGALLIIVNNHRNSMGYNSLNFSEVAYEYANLHTDYMISIGSINHDNFSSRASSMSSKVSAEYVAENVAKNYATASGAFDNWLSSSAHRKTMEGEFTHTGISVKKDANGNLYFTQLFYR